MALTQTSPSPCAKCPSPVENRPPSTYTGRNSLAPLVSCLTSKLPPFSRGGKILSPWTPHAPPGTAPAGRGIMTMPPPSAIFCSRFRSEEHTSELQSRENLVCRLLLEKKK